MIEKWEDTIGYSKNAKVAIDVPVGVSGKWRIETFEVDEAAAKFDRLRASMRGNPRYTPEGSYHRLMRGENIIMSNTPDEIRDHITFVREAKGNVLINGLGLGVVIEMLMIKHRDTGCINTITVIEKSEDVLSLCREHYENKYSKPMNNLLKIIHDDAFTYKSPAKVMYDAVWHDIWDYVTSDNLPEMHKLHRKYGQKTRWQGSWCRGLCEDQKIYDSKSVYNWEKL